MTSTAHAALASTLLLMTLPGLGCQETARTTETPDLEPTAAKPAAAKRSKPKRPDTFHCRACGRHLFDADQIKQRRPLWDLGQSRNEVYVLDDTVDLSGLRRYDASLHEGWYCCRFALMRMTVDKFGTGDALLAYVGDVERRTTDRPEPKPAASAAGQRKVDAAALDAALAKQDDTLRVVKLSARWCPPCRLLDQSLSRLVGKLTGVEVLEVDVDAHPELAERFAPPSIPMLRFYYRGRAVDVRSTRLSSVGGGLIGGLPVEPLRSLLESVRDQARRGVVAMTWPQAR